MKSFTLFCYHDYRYANDGLQFVFCITVAATSLDAAISKVRNYVRDGLHVDSVDYR